ncbi:uncharacterized protein LOC120672580 [Panicum virgatum]|uniref:Uncharacterized protein n=1 Tax=Panicum virgatum TaxID=38727 RepID=A0A8T0S4N9_PANVG|nr:uncharacterized protein LOC120672580 [Panicum virgatum]KAG2592038.1 hypothetical protein PVAP13_5NG522900 [Panicum virgatum]
MASPGAVAEEGAASGQFPSPDRTTRTPEPSPKNSRAVRAGSPAVSSLGGGLPSAPAPQPHPRPKESDHKFCLFVLISSSFCAVCSVNPRRTRGLGNVLMRSRLEALKDEIHEVIFLEAYSGVANLRFVVIPLIAALAPCISLGCYFECIIATLFFSKLV